jgi:hypothetical protein
LTAGDIGAGGSATNRPSRGFEKEIKTAARSAGKKSRSAGRCGNGRPRLTARPHLESPTPVAPRRCRRPTSLARRRDMAKPAVGQQLAIYQPADSLLHHQGMAPHPPCPQPCDVRPWLPSGGNEPRAMSSLASRVIALRQIPRKGESTAPGSQSWMMWRQGL